MFAKWSNRLAAALKSHDYPWTSSTPYVHAIPQVGFDMLARQVPVRISLLCGVARTNIINVRLVSESYTPCLLPDLLASLWIQDDRYDNESYLDTLTAFASDSMCFKFTDVKSTSVGRYKIYESILTFGSFIHLSKSQTIVTWASFW